MREAPPHPFGRSRFETGFERGFEFLNVALTEENAMLLVMLVIELMHEKLMMLLNTADVLRTILN